MAPSAFDDELWKYAFDDLSRGRQEELPLESRPKRGPTYNPSGRNSVNHIPKKQRRELASAWGNPIRDEESEQMEGLAMGDFPWRRGRARQALGIANSEAIPPQPPRDTRGSNRGNNRLPSATEPRLPRGLPAHFEGRFNYGSQESSIPARLQGPVKDNTSSIEVFEEERVLLDKEKQAKGLPPTFLRAPEAAPRTNTSADTHGKLPREHWQEELSKCEFFIKEPSNDSGKLLPEWTFYHGYCMVYPNSNPDNYFRAKFEIRMKFPSKEEGLSGVFILSKKGLPDRIHRVDRLNRPFLDPPGINKRFCLISTLGSVPSASYRLELKDLATTEKLESCLRGIQMTVYKVNNTPAPEIDDSLPATTPRVRGANNENDEVIIIDSDVSAAGDDHDSDVMIIDDPGNSPANNDSLVTNHGGNSHQEKEEQASDNYVATEQNSNSLIDVSEVDARLSTRRAFEAISQVAQSLPQAGLDVSSSLDHLEPCVEEFLTSKHPGLGTVARSKIKSFFRGILGALIGHGGQQEHTDQHQPQIPTSMAEFLQPIRYDPESLQKLRGSGVLPEAAQATVEEINGQDVSKGWLSQVWNPNRGSDDRLAEDFAQLTASETSEHGPSEPEATESTTTLFGKFNNGPKWGVEKVYGREKKGLSSSIYA